MNIKFNFCEIEEPGEYQPPRVISTKHTTIEMDHLPNYKDVILYDDKRYSVYDVVHNVRKLQPTWAKLISEVTVTAVHNPNRKHLGLL